MTLPTVTEAEATTYFATTPRQAAWDAIAPADQAIAVTEAQTWLAQLCWNTTATCCGADFATSYTRAVSELALALHLNPTALLGGGATTGALGPIKRQKLGDLEVEYHPPGATAVMTASSGPLVLQRFPWLKDIVGCWLNIGSTSLIRRVRS